jgi:hypothetical protein
VGERSDIGKEMRRLSQQVCNAGQSRSKLHQDQQVLGVHCFREVAGLMLRGIPALTAGSGADGLK